MTLSHFLFISHSFSLLDLRIMLNYCLFLKSENACIHIWLLSIYKRNECSHSILWKCVYFFSPGFKSDFFFLMYVELNILIKSVWRCFVSLQYLHDLYPANYIINAQSLRDDGWKKWASLMSCRCQRAVNSLGAGELKSKNSVIVNV